MSPAIDPISILLVDDDPGILETLVDIFEDMGYDVCTATTGGQALDLLRQRPFNLALLDIRLPDMEGTELLAHARRLQPNMKCVMATGNTTLQYAIDSLNKGAYAYLLKPVDVPNVKDTVRRALEQQRLELQNRLLLDITDATLATLDVHRLLDIVLEKFVNYDRADGAVIFLLDPVTGLLIPRAVRGGITQDAQPVGTGLAGYAAQQECILAASGNALTSDPIKQQGIQAAIAAPLVARDRLVGVLRLDWRRSRMFTADEQELLQALAERAAVQIDNACQYEEERHLAQNLVERIGLEERLELISAYLMSRTGVSRCVVWLHANDSLVFAGAVGVETRYQRLMRRAELLLTDAPEEVQRMLVSGQATVVEASLLHGLLPERFLVEAGYRTALIVPLRFEGRTIGLVALDQPFVSRRFSDLQIRQAMTLAFMSAGAIQQARTIQEERNMARTLAESFLSTTPVRTDVELASRYEPASEVAQIGGDYYDFIELGPHRLGVVIGDVCGKGLTAAIYTGKAKDMLYAYARENFEHAQESGVAPSSQWVITRLNRALYSQMSEECMFITMMFGILDTEAGTFTYTNAAHPPPILYQPQSRMLLELTPSGPAQAGSAIPVAADVSDRPQNGMVGAFETMEFTEHTVHLEPGSVLAMFTDGVTEARSGSELLESEGVWGVVRASASGSAKEVADAVYNRANEFAHGHLRDDVAIVVIKNVSRS